ncbi:MAG: endonuclease/exonuclease/phosphatase family protein [Flavobacteriales bacterium]|nr:endonuclease/exonuclease/phosphatase family protein [Flavobacteriales bacterium]
MKKFFKSIISVVNYLIICGLLLSYLAPFISPNTFWPMAFFGLSHLVWLLLSLVFLLITFILKSSSWKYSLVALLLGIPFFNRTYSFGKSSTQNTDIKIVSFNTYALGGYPKNTSTQIDSYLNSTNADVAALIEWRSEYGKISKQNFPHQKTLNLTEVNFNKMLIVSKYKIVHSGLIDFGMKTYNLAGFVDLDVHGKVIRMYVVHLESSQLKPKDYHELKEVDFDTSYNRKAKNVVQKLKTSWQKRANQALIIQQHIEQCPHPVVLVGDFNDTPQSFVYQTLKSNKKDAFMQAGHGFETTFLKPFPLLRIDHILYDSHFDCVKYGSTKQIFSDHKLIFAELKVKEE